MRKFKPKNGFGDGTQWIECHEDGSVFSVKSGGEQVDLTGHYRLGDCVVYVECGAWVESHVLKTDPEPFQASWDRLKPFEIRNDDRKFKQGDDVTLRECSGVGE